MAYKKHVQIEFDPTKDAINQAKHGVSLALALGFEFETALVIQDTRFDYGEDRFQALGRIKTDLFMLVYTLRGHNFRAISLRPANSKEVLRYECRKG